MPQRVHPCFWYDGQATDAGQLYARAFGGDGPTGSGVTRQLSVLGLPLTLLDGGPQFRPNPSISLFARMADEEALDAAWETLAGEGRVLMPLQQYPWSERFGWVEDRFGVSWQLFLDSRTECTPALMYTGDQVGRADEAIALYTTLFANSQVVDKVMQPAGEGGAPSDVQIARIRLDDSELTLMDSRAPHDFGFSEGASLVIACADQAEVDHFWEGLTAAGGQESMCGWCKDRFGLSWQVVPTELFELMADPDRALRVVEAFMQMKKLDLDTLRQA